MPGEAAGSTKAWASLGYQVSKIWNQNKTNKQTYWDSKALSRMPFYSCCPGYKLRMSPQQIKNKTNKQKPTINEKQLPKIQTKINKQINK